ncbi:Uncharacterized protein Fot_39520 [Forsythia ovata]|uniref:Uncharacterized protein n=1 Tax=Forsythia ovata TaxID=205694 RepID=A0ABD1S5N7_9LAMI
MEKFNKLLSWVVSPPTLLMAMVMPRTIPRAPKMKSDRTSAISLIGGLLFTVYEDSIIMSSSISRMRDPRTPCDVEKNQIGVDNVAEAGSKPMLSKCHAMHSKNHAIRCETRTHIITTSAERNPNSQDTAAGDSCVSGNGYVYDNNRNGLSSSIPSIIADNFN